MSGLKFAAVVSVFFAAFSMVASGQETQKYYNVEVGPVYFTLTARNSVEYNDNINLSNGQLSPMQSDIVITPNLGLTAFSSFKLLPTTQSNQTTLSLSMNVGYEKHLQHSELDSKLLDLNIAPNSELSFLIRVGHFKIRVHDGFSLQSDPVTEGSLSNVAKFRRFVNSAGIDTEWDVNSKTTVSLGYTHSNLWALSLVSVGNTGTATNLNASIYNSSTDTVSLSARSQVLSLLNVGFAASASATSFPAAPSQDSSSFSYGPVATLRLTEYTSIDASCGITQSRQGNFFTGVGYTGNSASDTTSEYANISVTNRMNIYYNQVFSVGRQTSLNLLGTLAQTDYIRYSSTWNVNSHITLAASCYLEQSTDFGVTGPSAQYRRYGFDLRTSRQLSRKMTTSLIYRFTDKISGDSSLNYKQNSIVWSLDYAF